MTELSDDALICEYPLGLSSFRWSGEPQLRSLGVKPCATCHRDTVMDTASAVT